mgnify:CR=1 FL=1
MTNPEKITGLDILEYIKWKELHLRLEQQKIPFTQKDPKKREPAIKKLRAKRYELTMLKRTLSEFDLHKSIQFEKEKVGYLTTQKIRKLKEISRKKP